MADVMRIVVCVALVVWGAPWVGAREDTAAPEALPRVTWETPAPEPEAAPEAAATPEVPETAPAAAETGEEAEFKRRMEELYRENPAPETGDAGETGRVEPPDLGELVLRVVGSLCVVVGLIVLVGLAGEEIVHYCWLSAGESYLDRELDFRVDLRPDRGYLYDAYTRPGFRGRGCYREGLGEAGRWLRSRDRKTLLVIVDGGNQPARAAARRAGFLPVAVIFHRRILAWKWNLIRRTSDGEQLADS